MPDDEIEDLIRDALEKPASATVDGRSATARSVDELIKADEHLGNKAGRTRSTLPIRMAKLRPPGSA